MIFLELFITFAKIGLLSFGGGYAMISVAWMEVVTRAWISASEFVDIIAIAEMTPGPIAVNMATYTGYTLGGFFGGIVATTGVAAPSVVIILIISQMLLKYQNNPARNAIFYGVRLATAGLIASAALFIGRTAIFKIAESSELLTRLLTEPLGVIDLRAVAILIVALVTQLKFKLHPVITVVGAGILGIVLFYIF